MEFSRQEYESGLSIPSPGDLPDPVIKPVTLVPPVLEGGFFTSEPPGKSLHITDISFIPSSLLVSKVETVFVFLEHMTSSGDSLDMLQNFLEKTRTGTGLEPGSV